MLQHGEMAKNFVTDSQTLNTNLHVRRFFFQGGHDAMVLATRTMQKMRPPRNSGHFDNNIDDQVEHPLRINNETETILRLNTEKKTKFNVICHNVKHIDNKFYGRNP